MYKFLSFIFLLFFGTVFSQLPNFDKNNKNTSVQRINGAPVKEVNAPINLGFDGENGFKSAKQGLDKEREREKKEKEDLNKGIATPKQITKQNHQNFIEGNVFNFPQIDMDLGSFHTKSKNLHITSFDFGRFDGDRFQVSINGKVIYRNVLLTPNKKSLILPLQLGINRIEVTAVNEGKLLPNTGYFAFYDDSRKIVKEGEWMLATGAKVIAVVVREK